MSGDGAIFLQQQGAFLSPPHIWGTGLSYPILQEFFILPPKLTFSVGCNVLKGWNGHSVSDFYVKNCSPLPVPGNTKSLPDLTLQNYLKIGQQSEVMLSCAGSLVKQPVCSMIFF